MAGTVRPRRLQRIKQRTNLPILHQHDYTTAESGTGHTGTATTSVSQSRIHQQIQLRKARLHAGQGLDRADRGPQAQLPTERQRQRRL